MADAEMVTDDSRYYLKLAIEQYADVSLFFYLDKCLYSRIQALCVGMKGGYCVFRTDLASLEENPLVWGSEVGVYFVARDVENVPCQFRGKLMRIYNSPPDHMLLVLPIPDYIDHNQRRFSRRVNLDEDEAAAFRIWLGSLAGGDSENLPVWKWTNLDERGCAPGEISANGLRLDINKNNYLCDRIDVNDTVLLKGNFGTDKRPEELFVLGTVMRKMPKLNVEDEISIGCHFRSWRKVNAGPNQTWFRADAQEGVPTIARWVSRNFHNLNN